MLIASPDIQGAAIHTQAAGYRDGVNSESFSNINSWTTDPQHPVVLYKCPIHCFVAHYHPNTNIAICSLWSGRERRASDISGLAHNWRICHLVVNATIDRIILFTVFGIRELPFRTGKRPPREPGVKTVTRFFRWFTHTWVRLWRSRNFTLVFLTRTLIMTGLAMFMTFIEY
jgi:hypothetical protein